MWSHNQSNFERNLAIIVGIDRYKSHPSIRNLRTAVSDANAIADLLEQVYDYKQSSQHPKVIRLFDEAATLQGLQHLFSKTLLEQNLTERDRLIIYFAGHGIAHSRANSSRDSGPKGYLVPYDADPTRPESLLPMEYVSDALSKLECHHLLVVLDCCFAGTFQWAGSRKAMPVLETINREHYYHFIRHPAWQVITSSAHDQEALDTVCLREDSRQVVTREVNSPFAKVPHSPFALAFLEGLHPGDGLERVKADLSPDGVVTVHELFVYLQTRVKELSGEQQAPGIYPLRRDYDKGEFIFTPPEFDPEKALAAALPLNEENNPYRGLNSFDEKHAKFFFGRQALIDQLLERLNKPDQFFTVVLGASGSGKSSLVKAGLLPHLRCLSLKKQSEKSSRPWCILDPMRPGKLPFTALARTLLPVTKAELLDQVSQLCFLDELFSPLLKTKAYANPHSAADFQNQQTQSNETLFDKTLIDIAENWLGATAEARLLVIEDYFDQLKRLGDAQQQTQLKHLYGQLLAELDLLSRRLQQDPHYFSQTVLEWRRNHPGTQLLLVIDQFEELVINSNSRDETERPNPSGCKANHDLQRIPKKQYNSWRTFLEVLRIAIADHSETLRLVVTLRSDFEPRFTNTVLETYWEEGRFPVPAMATHELRQAIENPALKQALYFEELTDDSGTSTGTLVTKLIDEVSQMPGALPLLSFTLSELYIRLYERWRANPDYTDRTLRFEDYNDLHGVAGALTERANKAFGQLDPVHQSTIKRVMLRMVALEGGTIARRRVPESELLYANEEENQRVREVIDRLVSARLLVKGQEQETIYVEPAHDYLIHGWPLLESWIREEEEKLRQQRRLTPAAVEWDSRRTPNRQTNRKEKPVHFLWNADPYLDVLHETLNSDRNWFNRVEADFVKQSVRQRRRNISWRWRIAVGVMLGLSGLTIATLIGQRNAQIEQISASRQAAEASLLSNQELDALVSSLQAAKTLRQSLLLRFFKPETQLQNQVKLVLQKAVAQVEERNRIVLPDTGYAVAFSPDGQLIATAQLGGKINLWKSTGEAIPDFKLSDQEDEIQTLAFTSDGQQIITIDYNQSLKFWSLDGQQIKENSKVPTSSNQLATTSDGKPVLNSTDFERSELIDLENEVSIASFSETGFITNGVFSPDGKLIAADQRAGNTISVFEVDTGREVAQLQGSYFSSNVPISISFSPDATLIATGGFQDDTIHLWDMDGNLLAKFLANQGGIYAINFSSDGKRLASSGADGTLRIWQNLEGKQVREIRLPSDISDVDISSDGQLLAMSRQLETETGEIAEVINLSTGEQFAISQRFGSVAELLLSPINTSLVVSEGNGTVHQIDLGGQQSLSSFVVQAADINQFGSFVRDQQYRLSQGISFSQDENLLAIGGDNNLTVFTPNGQELDLTFDSTQPSGIGGFGENWVQASAFSHNSDLLAAVGVGGDMRILQSHDGKPLLPGPVSVNTTQTLSIAFNPTGDLIATAGLDGSINRVRLWKISGNRLEQVTELDGHADVVSQIIFSPDGNFIATASEDGTARIWDLSGQQLAQFEGANQLDIEQQVVNIAFSPDGQQLVLAYKTLAEGWYFHKGVKSWQIKDMDQLLKEGCGWARDYLQNNSNVEPGDRSLCDGVDSAEAGEASSSKSLTQVRPGEIQNSTDLLIPSESDQVTEDFTPPEPSEPNQTMEQDFYLAGQNKNEQEDYQGAIEDFSRAIEADSSNPAFYQKRAFSHYKLGDRESAFSDYWEASKLYEKQGEIDAYDEMQAKLHDLWTGNYTGGGYTITITGIGNDAAYRGCDANNNCLELSPAASYQQGNYVWINGNYQSMSLT